MKIENFELIDKKKNEQYGYTYYAQVDVTTGLWPFRKTRQVEVFRTEPGCWRFLCSGKPTPGFVVEQLETAHNGQFYRHDRCSTQPTDEA